MEQNSYTDYENQDLETQNLSNNNNNNNNGMNSLNINNLIQQQQEDNRNNSSNNKNKKQQDQLDKSFSIGSSCSYSNKANNDEDHNTSFQDPFSPPQPQNQEQQDFQSQQQQLIQQQDQFSENNDQNNEDFNLNQNNNINNKSKQMLEQQYIDTHNNIHMNQSLSLNENNNNKFDQHQNQQQQEENQTQQQQQQNDHNINSNNQISQNVSAQNLGLDLTNQIKVSTPITPSPIQKPIQQQQISVTKKQQQQQQKNAQKLQLLQKQQNQQQNLKNIQKYQQLQQQQQQLQQNNTQEEMQCNLHKRPIEVICIDPVCTAKSQKCCFKCLTVKSEHSQHQSIDLDEACEKYNLAVAELLQDQSQDAQTLKNQQQVDKLEQFMHQNIKTFSNLVHNEGNRVIKQLNQSLLGNQSQQLDPEIKNIFANNQLLDIHNPEIFKKAVTLTKQFMQKKNISEKPQITQQQTKEVLEYVKEVEIIQKQSIVQIKEITEHYIRKFKPKLQIKGHLKNKIQVLQHGQSENIRLQRKIKSQQDEHVYTIGSQVCLWDMKTGQQIFKLNNPEFITCMLQFDEQLTFLGSKTGFIYKFENQQQVQKADVFNGQRPISGMNRIGIDTFLTSSVSEQNTIILMNISCEIIKMYQTNNDVICYTSLLVLDNPQFFISASQKSKALKLWNVQETQKKYAITSKFSSVGLSLLKENKFILQELKHIILFQVIDYQAIQQLKIFYNCHQDWVRDLQYLDDYSCIITASQDKYIKVWNFNSQQNKLEISQQFQYEESIKNILFLNGQIISTSLDQYMQVWD